MFGVGRNFLIEENLAQRIVNFFFIVQFYAYGRDEARGDTQYIFGEESEKIYHEVSNIY